MSETIRLVVERGSRHNRQEYFERDSDVIFRREISSGSLQTCAGQIAKIFTAQQSTPDNPHAVTPFVAIHPYSPLPATANEDILALDRACRSFHPVGGYLSSTQRQDICIIRASDIICHFAKLSLDADIMHVLQLDRVRDFNGLHVQFSSDILHQLQNEGLNTEEDNIS